MVTKEQAIDETNREFHHVTMNQAGHPNPVCYRVRRTGKTKTWVTRVKEFKFPIKWGLWESSYITHENAHEWNLASTCPRCTTTQQDYVLA